MHSFSFVCILSMSDTVSSPLIQHLDLLLAQVKAGVVIHNPDTTVRYANPYALQILGLGIDEIKGKIADEKDWHFLDTQGERLKPEDYPVNRVLATGKPVENLELGIYDTKRRQPTWVKVAGFPEFNSRNELQQIVMSFIDISHTRNQVTYDQIMACSNDIVLVTRAEPMHYPGPGIVSINQAFTQLLGYEPDQVNGKPLSYLKIAQRSLRTLACIKQQMQAGNSFRGRLFIYDHNGKPLWLDINVFPLHNWQNRISHYVAIGRDITDTVSREESLISAALQDPLTGLYNRRGLEAKMQRYTKRQNDKASYSLITLDIDRFKQINDHWGHKAGDKVLVEVAHIMRETVRDIDCVARIGGEEFLILLPAMPIETAQQVAERLRARIAKQQIKLNAQDYIMVTASLGVAEKSSARQTLLGTLQKADEALYQAKRAGRNQVCRGPLPAGIQQLFNPDRSGEIPDP